MSRSRFALPCVLLLSLAVCGLAEGGQRSGTYSTASGRSGSYSQTFSHGDGAWQRQTQIDAANGKTYDRSVSGSLDRADHSLTRSVTGIGGRTRGGTFTYTPNR